MDGVIMTVVVRWEIWELWELPQITCRNNFKNNVVVVVMVVVVTDDWPHNFDTLAKDLGIPSNTLRRYFKLFQNFIPNKLAKRGTRFNRESKELFEDINKMYGQRMTTEEIMSTIAATRTPTLDVRPSAPPPAPTPDRQSPPALPEVMTALIPLAERFVVALETIAARMTIEEAPNRSYKRTDQPGEDIGHPDHQKPQEGADMMAVDKEALVREVHRLRGLGYGAARIRTTLVKAGWGSLAGPGHRLSKSTIAKIIKSNGSDV